jgi:hypothetical protein
VVREQLQTEKKEAFKILGLILDQLKQRKQRMEPMNQYSSAASRKLTKTDKKIQTRGKGDPYAQV